MSALLINLSVWLYSILLLAYPLLFRLEYSQEMTQVFRDMLRDAVQQRGCFGIWEVWFYVLPDWMMTVRQQHLLSGSYYRFRRIIIRMFQAIFSLIFFVFGLVYWLNAR